MTKSFYSLINISKFLFCDFSRLRLPCLELDLDKSGLNVNSFPPSLIISLCLFISFAYFFFSYRFSASSKSLYVTSEMTKIYPFYSEIFYLPCFLVLVNPY